MIALFVILQILDALTTWYALERAVGLSEGNVAVRWAMSKVGVIGALVAIKGGISAAVIFVPLPGWVLTAICLLYVVVVANNVYRIVRAADGD